MIPQTYLRGLMTKEVSKVFDSKLREHVKQKLLTLGYTFKTNNDFLEFVGKNVINVSDPETPGIHEIYLLSTEPATLLGQYTYGTPKITTQKNSITIISEYKFEI